MEDNKSYIEQEKKICQVVKCFLSNPNLSNKEIANLTDMSASSVQRFLTNPIIYQLFGKDTFDKINILLEKRKMDARKKGGLNSFQNNEPIKDSEGKFIGVKPASSPGRLEKKCQDILVFSNMFLRNPNLSLQQIADFYNENMPGDVKVTRNYVYDCLSSRGSYDLLADNLYEVISEQLKARRIMGNIEGANTVNK